jgi:hypothetical protein
MSLASLKQAQNGILRLAKVVKKPKCFLMIPAHNMCLQMTIAEEGPVRADREDTCSVPTRMEKISRRVANRNAAARWSDGSLVTLVIRQVSSLMLRWDNRGMAQSVLLFPHRLCRLLTDSSVFRSF